MLVSVKKVMCLSECVRKEERKEGKERELEYAIRVTGSTLRKRGREKIIRVKQR